jgi:hypothetical protein
MSAPEHTPGLIRWDGNWLLDERRNMVLYYTYGDDGIHGEPADKERLAACWNALEGIPNPAAIADVVAALEGIKRWCEEEEPLEYTDGMRKKFQRNMAERAEVALASLRGDV